MVGYDGLVSQYWEVTLDPFGDFLLCYTTLMFKFHRLHMSEKRQALVHMVLIYFWAVQMVLLPFVVIYLPNVWRAISFLYLIEISLYSCLSGDVDALAANQAGMKITTTETTSTSYEEIVTL